MNHRLPDLIAACSIATAVALAPVVLADAPAAVAPATTVVAPATTTTTVMQVVPQVVRADRQVVATTTTTVPAGDWKCPQWVALAVEVGWPVEELPTLDRIIHRESTCRADAHNGSDPGSVGSIGLAQVNSNGWCDPNRYWPEGFMQVQGIGVDECADLFDPAANLRAALVIWKRQGGYGAWGL